MIELEQSQVGCYWAFVAKRDNHGSIVRAAWGWNEDYVEYVVGYNVTMDSEEVCTGYVKTKHNVSHQEAQMIIGGDFVALCKPVWAGDLDYILCEKEEYGTPPDARARSTEAEAAWRYTRPWKDVITTDYATWLLAQQQMNDQDDEEDDEIYAVYNAK